MAFDPRKLTVKASEAIQRAQEFAEKKQHRFLRPLHLLKALLDEEGGLMTALLQKMSVKIPQLERMVDGEIDCHNRRRLQTKASTLVRKP